MKRLLAVLSLSLSFLPTMPAGAQDIVLSQSGSPPTQAADSGQSNAHSDVIRLMHTYLDAWADHYASPKGYVGLFGERAKFEFPHAGQGNGLILTGHERVFEGLRKLSAAAEDWHFSALEVYDTSFPNVFFVEYFAKGSTVGGSSTTFGRHLARIAVKDGQIADYYELWDQDAERITLGCVVR